MTLVLTAACRDHVFLVADRRLTVLGKLQDDNRNKATVYENRLAFGYSGLADIDGQPTDLWLAEQLAGIGKPLLETLAKRATDTWKSLSPHLSADARRHAFVMVGWGRDPARRPVPVVATISNALDVNGSWLAHATPTFLVERYLLKPRHRWGLFRPVGAGVGPHELADLHRRLRSSLKRVTRRVPAILALGDTIRQVAARDPTVGSSLVGVVLPVPSPGSNHKRFGAPLLGSASELPGPMAFDLTAADGEFKWVLPNIVFRRQLMTQGRIEAVDGRVTQMEMRISKPLPGYQAGLALVGENKGVFFGLDAEGKSFIVERTGDVTRLFPLNGDAEDPQS